MNPERKLNEIILSITNRCNLRCAMCQIPDRSCADELGTEDVRTLITDAAALFPTAIVFSGGEPLLRADIFELVALANRKKMNTCLTTNGTLVDDAVAGRLAAAGIGVVNVSLEGPLDVHDQLRGAGNYQRALAALGHLRRHHIETTIATVVCRQNYRFLLEVMKLATSTGTTTVKFQPFSPIFLTDKEKGGDFFLPPESRRDCEGIVEEVIAWAAAHKMATNPVGYLRSLPSYLCGQGAKAASSRCAALWTSCPISAQGDVHPCWVFAGKVLGNIKKNKLSQIWNSRDHDRVRRRILEKECLGCFMSCYDANLGKPPRAAFLIPDMSKFRKPKYYKRSYFRLYQYARYFFGKISRRIFGWGLRKPPAIPGTLADTIQGARDMLRRKLKDFGDA
jgi:MoaA/NifB/PqqE/SkfB family radical SAM enzyme